MVATQQGDRADYASLLQEIVPRIRMIAARSFRDRRDVEDVVQDVLLTLHSTRHTFDPTRSFAPWLHGLIRHRIADRLRVCGRAWSREVAIPENHEALRAFAMT